MSDEHLGRISIFKYPAYLESPTTRPILSVVYRAWPKERDLERTKIENMMAMNVIKPAQTEWTSTVVFARKKDETLRFCVDYRELDAATSRD